MLKRGNKFGKLFFEFTVKASQIWFSCSNSWSTQTNPLNEHAWAVRLYACTSWWNSLGINLADNKKVSFANHFLRKYLRSIQVKHPKLSTKSSLIYCYTDYIEIKHNHYDCSYVYKSEYNLNLKKKLLSSLSFLYKIDCSVLCVYLYPFHFCFHYVLFLIRILIK